MLEPDNFLEREMARLTASILERGGGGGLVERSVGTDVANAAVLSGSKLWLSICSCLERSWMPVSARAGGGRASSEAERLMLGAFRGPDQLLVQCRLSSLFGDVDSGVNLPVLVSTA